MLAYTTKMELTMNNEPSAPIFASTIIFISW